MIPQLRGIYAIVNEGPRNPVELAQEILESGVRILQYRAKDGIVDKTVRELRRRTRSAGALLILNDRWDAVDIYDADGAHLGPQDVAPGEFGRVRAALRGRIMGLSCGTVDEAREAQNAGADYVGAGSVYATRSKVDAGSPIGLRGLHAIVEATNLPVAAIGGIRPDRIAEVRKTGAAMAAVLSVFADAPDARSVGEALVAAWEAA